MARPFARAFLAVVLASIVSSTAGAQPAAAPAAPPVDPTASAPSVESPDLSGYWLFTVDVGERDAVGELTLGRSGDAYLGTLTTRGQNTLAIRLLTLIDGRIDLVVESREGLVTFEGALGADGASMSGIVHYHHGQNFPMTVTRRPAPPQG